MLRNSAYKGQAIFGKTRSGERRPGCACLAAGRNILDMSCRGIQLHRKTRS